MILTPSILALRSYIQFGWRWFHIVSIRILIAHVTHILAKVSQLHRIQHKTGCSFCEQSLSIFKPLIHQLIALSLNFAFQFYFWSFFCCLRFGMLDNFNWLCKQQQCLAKLATRRRMKQLMNMSYKSYPSSSQHGKWKIIPGKCSSTASPKPVITNSFLKLSVNFFLIVFSLNCLGLNSSEQEFSVQ